MLPELQIQNPDSGYIFSRFFQLHETFFRYGSFVVRHIFEIYRFIYLGLEQIHTVSQLKMQLFEKDELSYSVSFCFIQTNQVIFCLLSSGQFETSWMLFFLQMINYFIKSDVSSELKTLLEKKVRKKVKMSRSKVHFKKEFYF